MTGLAFENAIEAKIEHWWPILFWLDLHDHCNNSGRAARERFQ